MDKKKLTLVEPVKNVIIPKKNWHIVQNEVDLELKKGVKINVPFRFLNGLKLEGVI